jgi:hypothetical protein
VGLRLVILRATGAAVKELNPAKVAMKPLSAHETPQEIGRAENHRVYSVGFEEQVEVLGAATRAPGVRSAPVVIVTGDVFVVAARLTTKCNAV